MLRHPLQIGTVVKHDEIYEGMVRRLPGVGVVVQVELDGVRLDEDDIRSGDYEGCSADDFLYELVIDGELVLVDGFCIIAARSYSWFRVDNS